MEKWGCQGIPEVPDRCMRLLVDSLFALMLCAVLAAVVIHTRSQQNVKHALKATRADVQRFQRQVTLQAALGLVEQNEGGFPAKIEPKWFNGHLPRNPLIGPGHPWLEMAGYEQRDLIHPPDRTAFDTHVAQFWYNAHTGQIRARVPPGLGDSDAVEMYNFINDCDLPELLADGSLTR